MTADLLPCPFCGGKAEYFGQEGAGYRVVCEPCNVRGGWGDYGYQAAAKWNRRAIPAAVPGVKPLVWEDHGEVFSTYDDLCGCVIYAEGHDEKKREEAARAARIISALAPQPARDVREAVLVADALDAWANAVREGRQIDASITGLRDMAKTVRALIEEPRT